MPKTSALTALPLLFLLTSLSFFVPGTARAERGFARHSGYLESIDGERQREAQDMIVIQPPPAEGPTLKDRIFNDKLSKEFSDRYEEKFGRTEVERIYYSPNRYTFYDDMYGFRGTPQDVSDERHHFADFMVRRLVEYHVDNFTKSDPRAHAIWVAKERLSNVNVQVQQVRFDMNYDIAGNTFDMKINNPWLDVARLRMQMNQSAFGPGQIDETTLSLGRPLTISSRVEAHYKFTDGIVKYIVRKSFTPTVGGTVTVSTFTRDSGASIRESLYLAGGSYVF